MSFDLPADGRFGFQIRGVFTRGAACMYSVFEAVPSEHTEHSHSDKPVDEPDVNTLYSEKKGSKVKETNTEMKKKACEYLKRCLESEGSFPPALSLKELYGRREAEWAKLIKLCLTAQSQPKFTEEELQSKDRNDLNVYIRQLFGTSIEDHSQDTERVETNIAEPETELEPKSDALASSSQNEPGKASSLNPHPEMGGKTDDRLGAIESALQSPKDEGLGDRPHSESESPTFGSHPSSKSIGKDPQENYGKKDIADRAQNQVSPQNNYGEINSFQGLIERISAIGMASMGSKPNSSPQPSSNETSEEPLKEPLDDLEFLSLDRQKKSEHKISAANGSPEGFRINFDTSEENSTNRVRSSDSLSDPQDGTVSFNDRSDKFKGYCLFLYNVPVTTSRTDLQNALLGCGEIISTRIVIRNHRERATTIAFVHFSTQDGLNNALDKVRYGIPIQGRIVKGDIARRNHQREYDFDVRNVKPETKPFPEFSEDRSNVSAPNPSSEPTSSSPPSPLPSTSPSHQNLKDLDQHFMRMELLGQQIEHQITILKSMSREVQSSLRDLKKIVL